MVILIQEIYISGGRQSKMNKKTSIIFLGMILLVVLLINFAAAEFWACFSPGDRINYCNNYRPSETYTGSYPRCMSVYRPADNCYVHGVLAHCNLLPPKCSNGSGGGGNTTFDLTPPVLKIISPLNNSISNSKKLFLNFSLDEVATVYYRDMNKSTSTWTKVCEKCGVGNPTYAKLRSFAEGKNDLMFKAVDVVGNEGFVRVNFLIDSTKPKIYKTEPMANQFADGTFTAQFKELNPKKLTLHYGNDTANADLSKCYYSMGKMNCDISVNLSKYNSQTIAYFFDLEDIAGNKYSTRPILVKVDTKFPVVNNPSSFFKVNGRYVEYNLSIDEPNLYKVTSLNILNPRATPSTMCTRLTKGYCYKKQILTPGNYSFSIQISDKAGHSIALPANFKIN
jgi:hypothetical protein